MIENSRSGTTPTALACVGCVDRGRSGKLLLPSLRLQSPPVMRITPPPIRDCRQGVHSGCMRCQLLVFYLFAIIREVGAVVDACGPAVFCGAQLRLRCWLW